MAFEKPLLISNLKDLKLNCNNAGVQAFFKDVIAELNKKPMGAILIRHLADAGIGGMYDSELHTDCITLDADDTKYDSTTNTLTFIEKGIYTFVHESSHFMHLSVDHGKFVSPCYKDVKPFDMDKNMKLLDKKDETTGKTYRFMAEVEAGCRSVIASIMYDMGFEKEIAGDNLVNLLCYGGNVPEEFNTLRELPGKYRNADKSLRRAASKLMLEICIGAAENHKFSEFNDIDEFTLTLKPEQMNAIKKLVKKFEK